MKLSKKIKPLLEGERFHKWTVIKYSHTATNQGKNAYYICRCVCGNTSTVMASKLRGGKTKQCKSCSSKVNGRRGIYVKDKNKRDLYMLKCGPWIKIGATNNIKKRVASIQSLNPYPVTLVGFWKDEGYLEEKWHNNLSHLERRGEWFKAGVCEIL